MINRYDKGFTLNIPTTGFSTSLDILAKGLMMKQQVYDQNLALAEEVGNIASTVKAIGGHRDIVSDITNGYSNTIYEALDNYNGDYSMLTPKLTAVKRQITMDKSLNGRLGKIQNFYDMFQDWDKTYKNDKDVDSDLYSKVKHALYDSTYLDKDSHTTKGRFNPDSELFLGVGKGVNHTTKDMADMLDKYAINENGGTQIYYDNELGKLVLKTTENKTRGGQQLHDAATVWYMNDENVKTNMKAREALRKRGYTNVGNEMDIANGAITTAYNSAIVNSHKSHKSLSDVADERKRKYGLVYDEYDVNMGTRDFQPKLNPQENTGDWINGLLKVWNKVYDDKGNEIGYDPSWANQRKNMVNEWRHRAQGTRPNEGYVNPLIDNYAQKLMEAPDLRTAQALMDNYDKTPEAQNWHKLNIMGQTITDPKERLAANNFVIGQVDNLVDVNGNFLTASQKQKYRKAHSSGKVTVLKIPPQTGAGHNGTGVIMDETGDRFFLDIATPGAANQANQVTQLGQQNAIFDNEGNVETFLDPRSGKIVSRHLTDRSGRLVPNPDFGPQYEEYKKILPSTN